MKQLLAILCILSVSGFLEAQSLRVNDPVDTETSLTAEELIRQVFVNGGCGDAALINLQDNTVPPTDFDNKSWGYFNRNGASFPFASGIVLLSGTAVTAEGPNTAVGSGTGNGNWAGDTDLKSLLDQQNGGDEPTTNATVFEFTFTPLTDNLSFDFIYASEEYQNQPGSQDFECNETIRDGFAFLIRGPGLPNDSGTAFGGTNIAVVPNSNNIPVNSNTIHANDFRCGNETTNTNFFPQLYIPNYVNSANSQATGFDGYTRSLTAMADVVSGEEYTIKIVVGDRRENILDSAIFLDADSFRIGVDLGPDITQDGGNSLCEGEEIILDISNSASVNDDITWFLDGMEIMGETGQTLSIFQSGTYTVEIDYANGCTGTDEILVEYAVTPEAQDANDFRVCNVDGVDVQFDLTQNDPVILGDQDPTAFRIRYFTTLDFAERNREAIPNATRYEPISNPQTIYARIDDNATRECFDIITFTISLGVADIGLLDDFSVCDVLNDGEEVFDLTMNDDNALNGANPDAYIISYYTSATDAESGNNAITNPTAYSNTQSPQTIYLRMENEDDEDCFNTASFQIDVSEVEVGLLDDIGICSVDSNTSFDLTVNDTHAYNGLNRETFTVTYHESQADANTGANPIMTPDDYVPGSVPRTIFTRLASNADASCFDTGTFVLSTDGAVAGSPNNLRACDLNDDGVEVFDLRDNDDDILLGKDPAEYIVTYHISQADADTGDNPLDTMYTNSMSPEEIFARIENVADPSCFDTTFFDLIVSEQPVLAGIPNNLESCDEGGGVGTYNLEVNTPIIIGGQDPMQYNVTYFESQEDADENINSIRFTDNYQNTIPGGQEIVARLSNVDNAFCYETVSFELSLSDVMIGDMVLLDRCRQNNMTPLFDLTENEANALSNVFADNYVVTYYENLPNAEAGANALLNPDEYRARRDRQIIYVRIENVNNEECFDIGEFVLNVSLANLGDLVNLGACAPEGDVTEFFDLTLNTPNAITGQDDDEVTVTYHLNANDAMMDMNAIDNPTQYENISNPQTMHLRIESNESEDCFNTGSFDILVSQQPVVENEPDDFLNCDGNMQFDLTQNDALIRGSQDPLLFTVNYYESMLQAEAGGNPIPNPTNYTQTENPQIIYARLENVNNGNCNELVTFVIESVDLEVGPVIRLEECDADGNGEEVFDLSENDINALNGLDAERYVVTYHISQIDADTGDDPLPTMYTNTANPETIFVRLEEPNVSGCDATGSFELLVNPTPTLISPTPLRACDDDNDGFFAFNLQDKDDEITQGNPDYIVSYHLTLRQAQDNVSPLPTPYTNTTEDFEVVHARVEDRTTTCVDFVDLNLEVYDSPILTASDYDILFCETEDGTPDSFSFNNDDVTNELLADLFSTPLNNPTITYHFSSADADTGDNPIADGFEFDQTMHNPIFIRVENSDSPQPCYNESNLASLTININTNPQFTNTQIDPIFLCADEPSNQNLSTMFNLTEREAQINTTGNPDVMVVYYASQADFDMGIAIPSSDVMMYSNMSNPQTIIAELFNPTTGCRSDETVSFDLNVQPLPVLPGQLQAPQGNDICVDEQGNLFAPFEIGYDLGATDGQEYRYDWTPDNVDTDGDGFEDPIFEISNLDATTTFSLTVTRINDEANDMPNCSNNVDPLTQDNYSVTFTPVFPLQGITVDIAEPAFSFPDGYTVTLTPTLTNTTFVVEDYQYQIDDGPFQNSNVFFNVTPGRHTARVVNIAECDEAVTTFNIIDYPRFFTPNNDGFNDFWNITSIDSQQEAKIYIFDRYGKLLKQLSPQSQGWDGTFNGSSMPSTDYWFSVEYLDDDTNTTVEFRANFTLKR